MIIRATSIFAILLLAVSAATLPAQNAPPPVSVAQASDQLAAQALSLLNAGKLQEAGDAYASLIQRYPTAGAVPEALYRLGYIRFVLGDYPAAMTVLARIQTPPAAPEIKMAADLLLPQILATQASKMAPTDSRRAATFQNAISQYDAFVKKYPRSPNVESAIYGRAVASFQTQDFDGAIKSLQANLKQFPSSPTMLDSEDLLALVLSAQASETLRTHGDKAAAFAKLDQAIQYLADIVKRQSDVSLSNSAQFQIGEILFNRANFEDPAQRASLLSHAIEAYRAVQPKDRVVQAQKARVALVAQRLQQAAIVRNQVQMKLLQAVQDRENSKLTALDQAPDQTPTAQLRIASCYFLLQKYDEARVLLRYIDAFTQDPEIKKQILFYTTMTYASQGIMDKAVAGYDDFQSKYKGDPLGENLPVALAGGYLLPKNNQLDKAIQYFNEEARRYPKSPLVSEALSQEATALGGLKRYDEAIRTYQKFIATNPPQEQAIEAQVGIAKVYQLAGRNPDAIKQYQKVADTYPGTPQAEQSAYFAARLKLAAGDPKGGLADLQAFVKKFPQSASLPEASMIIGQVKASLGDKAGALQAYKEVAAKFPQSEFGPQAYFQQAVILGGEQKTAEMLAVMRSFIAAYPDSKDIFYAYDTIGQTQVSQKKIADAVATYTEMAEKHPDNPMAATSLYRAADLWRKTSENLGRYLALNEQQRAEWNRDIASSLEAAEKVVQQFPDSDAAALALKTLLDDQRLLLSTKQKTSADVERYFTELASKAGTNVSAKSRILFTLATYIFEKDKPKALGMMTAAYKPSLVYAPADLDLYGNALIEEGKPDAAYGIYEKIGKDYPVPPNTAPAQASPTIQEAQATALFGMAHALEKQGKTVEAGNLYAQLKSTYPWSPKVIEANFGIAQSLFQQKKYDDALKLLVQIVGARTASTALHAQAFLLLGQIYEAKGKLADAIDSYLKIATFYAGVPDAAAEGLWNGGQLLERQAASLTEDSSPKKSVQLAKAKEAYQDLISKYPDSQYVAKATARVPALGQ